MTYTKPIMEKKVLENIVFNGTRGFILTCYCIQPQYNCNSFTCAHYSCSNHY